VLFFDAKSAQEKGWTKTLWVYDLRTNMHFTQKTNPIGRADLDEFVECYRRSFDYDDLVKRDKVNLDIFWLRDKSLEDSDDLPVPDVLAQEIADDLQTVHGHRRKVEGIASRRACQDVTFYRMTMAHKCSRTRVEIGIEMGFPALLLKGC
jgi:hypothetical protein